MDPHLPDKGFHNAVIQRKPDLTLLLHDNKCKKKNSRDFFPSIFWKVEDPKVLKVVEMGLCHTAELPSKDPQLTSSPTYCHSLVAWPWRWAVGTQHLDPTVMFNVVQEQVIVHDGLLGNEDVCIINYEKYIESKMNNYFIQTKQ